MNIKCIYAELKLKVYKSNGKYENYVYIYVLGSNEYEYTNIYTSMPL